MTVLTSLADMRRRRSRHPAPDDNLIRIRRFSQVTLPVELRKQFRLSEGDFLEATTTRDGILLTPVLIHPRFDPALAQGLRAEKDGQVLGPFNSVEEMDAAIDKEE